MSIHETKERKSGMVRVRGGFSDVNRIAPCNTTIQMLEFDNASRIQLSNKLFDLIETFVSNCRQMAESPLGGDDFAFILFKDILNDVLCQSNNMPKWPFDWKKYYGKFVKNVIFEATYNEVLDTIEYICRWLDDRLCEKYEGYAFQIFNSVFEKEYIGYRFVDGRIVAITDEHEIKAIEKACQIPFEGCRKHIEKAVGFLADRENKDYKNCIKESISAVESVCQVILNNNKTTLSDALKQLEKKGTQIHPALNHAFLKLYAYSCDQGGIRHAEGLTESDVSFEEAKFMLVSCCAFTNYLIAEHGKKCD